MSKDCEIFPTCPFCGGSEARLEHEIGINRDGGPIDFFYTNCWVCGAKGPRFTDPKPAIRVWNLLAEAHYKEIRSKTDSSNALEELQKAIFGD